MPRRSPELMAKIVVGIYNSEFRGKPNGRFNLTRDQIKEISGRSTLQDTIIDQLIDALYELGYCMVNVDGVLFAVIRQSVLEAYRQPTKKIITQIIEEYDAA